LLHCRTLSGIGGRPDWSRRARGRSLDEAIDFLVGGISAAVRAIIPEIQWKETQLCRTVRGRAGECRRAIKCRDNWDTVYPLSAWRRVENGKAASVSISLTAAPWLSSQMAGQWLLRSPLSSTGAPPSGAVARRAARWMALSVLLDQGAAQKPALYPFCPAKGE
jgi:hypothetical protein